jgi:hypothetical protein
MFQAVVAAASLATALGHGHLSYPHSRTQVAFMNGQDYCPHCALEDVPAPPGTGGRNYPGSRPFAEPGMATLTMGPCGKNGGNDYNAPARSWGNIVESYQAGQVISFESCWQADHKGAYSMRVCPDGALVSKFITPGVTPSSSEMTQLEQCFQNNVLPCTGVSGNRGCDAIQVGSGCQAGWGCASNTDWFYSPSGGAFNDGSCSTGIYTRDQVQLPAGFTSNHTLLSWRWDALDTSQLYTGCVDVSIR